MQGMANALTGSYFKNSHGTPFRYAARSTRNGAIEQSRTSGQM